ncbi:MAG: hypothetical protein ACRC63_01015, partial [Metamycoplasmataceae bacterium]
IYNGDTTTAIYNDAKQTAFNIIDAIEWGYHYLSSPGVSLSKTEFNEKNNSLSIYFQIPYKKLTPTFLLITDKNEVDKNEIEFEFESGNILYRYYDDKYCKTLITFIESKGISSKLSLNKKLVPRKTYCIIINNFSLKKIYYLGIQNNTLKFSFLQQPPLLSDQPFLHIFKQNLYVQELNLFEKTTKQKVK